MDKYNKKMLIHFLEKLTDIQSNAGCNDFDLKKYLPSGYDRRQMMKRYHDYNGDPEIYDPESGYEIVEDFIVVDYLIAMLTGEITEGE